MDRAVRVIRLASVALLAALAVLMAAPVSAQGTGTILAIEIRGAITQVAADHLDEGIARAEESGANALLVELDTPGGGLETTRNMVQRILNAEVPVIVHVTPQGSRAGSAGVFITYAAHVAAMAPGTNIGAATPIDAGGESAGDKILEDTASFARSLAQLRGRDEEFAVDAVREARSVSAETALELGVVEQLASSREELLAGVDGTEVELSSGETVTLATSGVPVVEREMPFTRQVLQFLANPQLAFLFISIGTLAVIYEFINPGVGIGGALGAVMLILAFYSLSVLPTNAAGVALLVIAVGFLVAELFAPGIGVLAGAGTIALLAAGLLLFDESSGITISPYVLLPTVLVAGGGAAGLAIMAARDLHRPSTIGYGAMIGREGEVRTASDGYAQVFVGGELWEASTGDAQLQPGQRVRVVGQEDLRLLVEVKEN